MAFLVWLDAAFDCATAERDHNAIRPRTVEKMMSEFIRTGMRIHVCKNIEGLNVALIEDRRHFGYL